MRYILNLLLSLVFLPFASGLFAQSESALALKILQNDSLLFHEAFNKCKLEHLNDLISDDFEFYHDQGGITNGKANFISSIENNICNIPYKPRRELIEAETKIFPLHSQGELYGVLQMGKHKFYAKEEGKAEYFTSIADFTHLWILENGEWKVKRVISYNHLNDENSDSN